MIGEGRTAVLGAGSWGTALALTAAQSRHRVRLWARRRDLVEEIKGGASSRYLPGVPLGSELCPTADLDLALGDAALVVLAVPSGVVAEVCAALRARPRALALPVVCAAKGLEPGTGRRMSQVMAEVLRTATERHAVLVGPSHAEEVARRIPTAVVLGGGDAQLRAALQERLAAPFFRVYTNDDLVGLELAAAVKNVLAIAAGICDGLGLGDNTKGALLTRGVAEIARLGVASGARRETFFGLAGIGDVITTCLSRHSRNRRLGERIGAGATLCEALAAMTQVAEGVETARTVSMLARAAGVSMPICDQVAAVLFGGQSPGAAIEELMGRALRSEHES
jgi:glycerol-3-phosphate dehydrogenase (NAD(P)+)